MASDTTARDTATRAARGMWTLVETVHALTYFMPHVPDAFARVGVPGFWRSYFAARAAPLGPVGPAPVTALFLSFAPSMVARALPDVWTRITPEEAVHTRLVATTAALHEVLGATPRDVVDDVVAALEEAATDLDCSGRALAAAHRALPWPDDPLARLWWATTLLREHRGDGHVAALVTAGVTGLEAQVWRAALDGTRAQLQGFRGWTDEQWSAAQETLAARGWLDAAGSLTPAGREAHRGVEETTDALAAAPWRALGPDRTERLARQLRPLAETAAGFLRYPNPIGLERPRAS
ncbi:MAG TPA: hypothetical protein VKP64_13525 [Mycobacteriales bacterium]|nr:hypothetical protein [Mycobacteriales bacterium]